MDPQTHRHILRAALIGSMSPRSFRWVLWANLESDLHQFSAERHFDSAAGPAALCERWQQGFHRYLDRAVAFSAPLAKNKIKPHHKIRALIAFGQATHALADFYAHTNWVELCAARNDLTALAPLLDETIDPGTFPPGLQSGFFSFRYGLDGCPHKDGQLCPPPGFRWCHEQLAKDHAGSGHGADLVSQGGPTFHAAAAALAIAATRQLWDVFHTSVVAKYGSNPDAEALFRSLAWG